jgi:acyl-CoA synthetase (AMP-forming)/AMP-acid ligase II
MAVQTPSPATRPSSSTELPGTGPVDLSYEPLTPTRFLERSALVFGSRTAVVDGDRRFTWTELWDRARALAGALEVEPGERVAVLAPNTHVLLEAHYGVPLAGAVLVALNTRLTAEELALIVEHAGARLLVHDQDLAAIAGRVRDLCSGDLSLLAAGGSPDEYEARLSRATPLVVPVTDERALIALNYTSGTTGRPKGVMYHHRGAYLQALAMALHARLDPDSVFLWTLPMFHCNGWCFPWAVTAAGGIHLCLRAVDPAQIWRLIREQGVTHFNAAPTVLTMLAEHPAAAEGPAPRPVRVATGGAPPSPTLLARMRDLGMDVLHLYGLTETFGPIALCDWWPEWTDLPTERQAELKARQGVSNVASCRLRVVDADGRDVPADGATIGELAVRGNTVMLGYYRDPTATARAVPDGWFRTGDLGVTHPDGYVEIKDRAKDVIISGGENIASVEVERVLAAHPVVLEVAVIGVPDDRWGEVPAAYVTLKADAHATAAELIEHCRAHLAHFKAPKHVNFGPLPKTSTGKIQKHVLREEARAGRDRRVQ